MVMVHGTSPGLSRDNGKVSREPERALVTSAQGLVVKGPLDYDDYCQAIQGYEAAEYALPWWIGDLLIEGLARFGDDAWAPVMERVGQRTAKNYLDVCLAFPRGQRIPGVSLGKHAVVVSLLKSAPRIAVDLLVQAQERAWNRYQLREHVKREQARIRRALADTTAATGSGEPVPEEVVTLARDAGQPSVETFLVQAQRVEDRETEREQRQVRRIDSPHRMAGLCPTCCCVAYVEDAPDA